MNKIIEAVIFDLDGVLVDTAKYHFLAWKELAMSISVPFDEHDNEELKGVSRMQSLDYILKKAKLEYTPLEKEKLATLKNLRYLEHISTMEDGELMPGALALLEDLKNNKVKIALGSASKNASFILDRLNITKYFDAIVDGTMTLEGKPSPETFLMASQKLGIDPQHCLVVEDASKGVDAALTAGMWCLGIGSPESLKKAHWIVSDLDGMSFAVIEEKLKSLAK